jgi:hypothetical protein
MNSDRQRQNGLRQHWLIWGNTDDSAIPDFPKHGQSFVDGFDEHLLALISEADPDWVPPNDAELDDDELMDRLNDSWALLVRNATEAEIRAELDWLAEHGERPRGHRPIPTTPTAT